MTASNLITTLEAMIACGFEIGHRNCVDLAILEKSIDALLNNNFASELTPDEISAIRAFLTSTVNDNTQRQVGSLLNGITSKKYGFYCVSDVAFMAHSESMPGTNPDWCEKAASAYIACLLNYENNACPEGAINNPIITSSAPEMINRCNQVTGFWTEMQERIAIKKTKNAKLTQAPECMVLNTVNGSEDLSIIEQWAESMNTHSQNISILNIETIYQRRWICFGKRVVGFKVWYYRTAL